MKHATLLLFLSMLLFSCGNKSNTQTNLTNNDLSLPEKHSDEMVILTITGSDFAGTYQLKNEDVTSQMTVGYDEDSGHMGISLLKIQPTDASLPKLTMAKWAEGKADKGTFSGAGKCLFFQIVALEGNKPYKKVNGFPKGCGDVTITQTGAWVKSNIIYQKRGVTGYYKDEVILEVRRNDDSLDKQEATFEVQFALIQKEKKTK